MILSRNLQLDAAVRYGRQCGTKRHSDLHNMINAFCLKVTRKRRRYAIDPCLGYYIYAASKNTGGISAAFTQSRSSDSEKFVIPTSFDAEREMELPCATHLIEQATSVEGNADGTSRFDVSPPNNPINETPNQHVLTVEAFLKQTLNERAIKTRKTRTYEKKKHRVQGAIEDHRHITSNTDGRLCENLKETNNCDGDGEEGIISSSTTFQRKFFRTRRKPLKERLYAAAVSTYGVPDAYYSNTCAANGVVESSRVPLQFLPGPQIHPLGRKSFSRSKSLLVDPRKSAAMQKARFACRNYITELRESGVLTNTLDVMPLSKWNLSSKNGGHVHKSASEVTNKRKQRKLTEDTVLLETTCPPLAFISFQEAEEKYDSMFSSRW